MANLLGSYILAFATCDLETSDHQLARLKLLNIRTYPIDSAHELEEALMSHDLMREASENRTS